MSRREHSRKELTQKLRVRGIGPETIVKVLEQLAKEGLQSDHRYTESFLSSRIHKGYGPVRLQIELRDKGIDESLVEDCLEEMDIDWMDALRTVREKKFGAGLPGNYKEQAKESRFLQYRGFTSEQIRRLYK